MADIDNDWISEVEMATQLGMDRSLLRHERLDLAHDDFRKVDKVVFWRKSAALRLADVFRLSVPANWEKSAPGTPLEAAPASVVEVLTVESAPGLGGHHFGNPNLIRATRKDGSIAVVRVVSSAKYVKGMTLKAQPSPSGNWWTLVGREPRFVGAW